LKTPKGYLVAIEGVDAVGKNTQTLLLFEWLTKKKVRTVRMAFPDYSTPTGKEITSFLSHGKRYPIELQHILFAANRWEKRDEIKARLDAGFVVVVDRYTESNLAYGTANGLDVDWLSNLETGLPRADLVLVLDAPIRTVHSRRPASRKDTYERRLILQAKTKRAYKALAQERGWTIIDASMPRPDVQKEVLKAFREALLRDRGVTI
jgi:dTMP kinase